MLGRLGGVFRGTVMQFEPGAGFFVADAFWLPPDGDPIGPMALEVSVRPEGAGATRVRVTQNGYEESAALAPLLRGDWLRLGARARVAEDRCWRSSASCQP